MEDWNNFYHGFVSDYSANQHLSQKVVQSCSSSEFDKSKVRGDDEDTTTIVPDPSPLHISTKSKIAFFDQPIDLSLFWDIPLIHLYDRKMGVVKKERNMITTSVKEYNSLMERIRSTPNTYNIPLSSNDLSISNVFYDKRKISIGMCSKDLPTMKKKKKLEVDVVGETADNHKPHCGSGYSGSRKSTGGVFNNCMVLVIRMYLDIEEQKSIYTSFVKGDDGSSSAGEGEGYQKEILQYCNHTCCFENMTPQESLDELQKKKYDGDVENFVAREYHIKIFSSGRVKIPGIQHPRSFYRLLKYLQLLFYPFVGRLMDIHVIKTNILVNSDFRANFCINRDKLYKKLLYQYNIHAIFDSCNYHGIQMKIYYDVQAEKGGN